MARSELRLNCERCGTFVEYDHEQMASDGSVIVRCVNCGKRNSDENIHMINPYRSYDRDERGELLGDPL